MKKILSFLLITSISFFVLSPIVSAQMLQDTGELSNLTNEVATAASFSRVGLGYLIARVIQIALGLLATIFLILMILSGFRWMTAEGNDEEVKKAKTTIKTTIIGLVIILAAYAITYFVLRYLPFSGGSAGMPNPV